MLITTNYHYSLDNNQGNDYSEQPRKTALLVDTGWFYGLVETWAAADLPRSVLDTANDGSELLA